MEGTRKFNRVALYRHEMTDRFRHLNDFYVAIF